MQRGRIVRPSPLHSGSFAFRISSMERPREDRLQQPLARPVLPSAAETLVPVYVQRDRRRCVPDLVTQPRHVPPLSNANASAGVAEVVEADLRQIAGVQPCRLHRRTEPAPCHVQPAQELHLGPRSLPTTRSTTKAPMPRPTTKPTATSLAASVPNPCSATRTIISRTTSSRPSTISSSRKSRRPPPPP